MFPSRILLSRILRWFQQGFVLIISAVLFYPPPFLLAEATAAGPDWWAEQGVLASGTTADDYAAINQGQLKNLATKAAQAMEAKLSGGAGSAVWGMINGWSISQNGTRTPTPGDLTDDYAIVTLGQVKAVAKPFYDRLIADGKAIGYPWDGTWPADDYAVANIGQVKFLFSFVLPDEAAFPLGPWSCDSPDAISAVGIWYASREGASCGETGILDLGSRETRAWLQFDERVSQTAFTYVSFNLREQVWNLWNGVPMGPYEFFRFNGITLAGGDGLFVSDGTGGLKEVIDAPGVMKPRGSARVNEWSGPLVIDRQKFVVCIDNVRRQYSVYIDQQLVASGLSFTSSSNPRLEFLSPPELSLARGIQVDSIMVLSNATSLPALHDTGQPTVLSLMGKTLLFENFSANDWATLSNTQSLQQINDWEVQSLTNGGGYLYVSNPWVACLSYGGRLSRNLGILPKNKLLTLRFWLKTYPNEGALEPIVSFNGVELAFHQQNLYIRSAEGTWKLAPTEASWWAYNDTANDNRRSYGFDRIELTYDQAEKTYSLLMNGRTLLAGQNYLPDSGASALTFSGLGNEYSFDDISLIQRSGNGAHTEGDVDSDGDGIPDYWENLLGSDPNVPDADGKAAGTDKTYWERYEELINGRPDPAAPAMAKPTLHILTPTL